MNRIDIRVICLLNYINGNIIYLLMFYIIGKKFMKGWLKKM